MYSKNGFENCYEELKTFYPVFYLDVFEMQAILSAHGNLADEIIRNIDLVIKNNFIQDADEPTVTRLEKFLWISVDKSRPLDERKRLVSSFFVGYGKISSTKIKEMIRSFTDADSSVVFAPGDEKGNNFLTILVDRGSVEKLFFADIATVLFKKLPAHLAYSIAVRYTFPTVISSERKHYHHEYELCGTKPEAAYVGAIKSISAQTQAVNKSSLFEYKSTSLDEHSGQHPVSTLLGEIKNIPLETAALTTHTPFGYKSSSETDPSGAFPKQAFLGEYEAVHASAEVNATAYSVEYRLCGTDCAKI